ncbi:TPA: P-loop NTPase [archaeon]|nr:P-loop NTPase [Candidatus Naiadarchaeales archaeon SRR2090159.bin1288]
MTARYIAILSGKGGVGKTTTTINLAVALAQLNHRVVVVDTNLVTPNVSLHLGLPPTPTNLNAVLKNQAKIHEAVTYHESGIHVIPAGLSVLESANNITVDFKDALAPLSDKYDFVLLDCAAGLWGQIAKAVKAADDVLIVTNPELPALVDALKSIKMAEKLGINVKGVILNKSSGESHEVKQETIDGILNGTRILTRIPFDKNVLKSASRRKPIVYAKPYSPAARAYKKFAAEMAGVHYKESVADIIIGAMASIAS